MASALFVALLGASGPVLPPMDGSEGELQLHFVDAGGVQRGGFACVGPVPSAATCIVRVWADEATLDGMAALPDVLYLEDV